MSLHKKFLIPVIFVLIGFTSQAQIPTDVPNPQDNPPVDFSDPANIIMFIVLPLCAILLFFIWRRRKKEDQKE